MRKERQFRLRVPADTFHTLDDHHGAWLEPASRGRIFLCSSHQEVAAGSLCSCSGTSLQAVKLVRGTCSSIGVESGLEPRRGDCFGGIRDPANLQGFWSAHAAPADTADLARLTSSSVPASVTVLDGTKARVLQACTTPRSVIDTFFGFLRGPARTRVRPVPERLTLPGPHVTRKSKSRHEMVPVLICSHYVHSCSSALVKRGLPHRGGSKTMYVK